MKSCIVTPTFNNEDYTIRCFDSICKNTIDYKIIWIDNGSSAESRQKVRKFLDENNVPYELILNEENLGFVKATNQGMKRAMELGAKFIILQNNDTEVYGGWLDRMIGVAAQGERIGIVGPITSPCTSWQSIDNLRNSRDEFRDLPKYENNPEKYAEIIKDKYRGGVIESRMQLAFFSTLIKADVISQLGFLSEEFGVGFGDDDDYCIRALKKGWKIFVAMDVFVFHNHRTTFKSLYTDERIDDMLQHNASIQEKKHVDFYNNILKEREMRQSLDNLMKIVDQQQKEIAFMRSSKLWQLRSLNSKFKFALLTPHKFLAKYFFKKVASILRKGKLVATKDNTASF